MMYVIAAILGFILAILINTGIVYLAILLFNFAFNYSIHLNFIQLVAAGLLFWSIWSMFKGR